MTFLVFLTAAIEWGIGVSTLAAVFYGPESFLDSRPGVMPFVCLAAVVSILIGTGLFFKKDIARRYLVYFSGYIAIEKTLIFIGVFSLNCKLIDHFAGIPIEWVSFAYHLTIVSLFTRPAVKRYFERPVSLSRSVL